jgi:hypothetical protein
MGSTGDKQIEEWSRPQSSFGSPFSKHRRLEDFLRGGPDDCLEVVDKMRLIGEAAGMGNVSPAMTVATCRKGLFDASQAGELLRASPEGRLEATRQMPHADIELGR